MAPCVEARERGAPPLGLEEPDQLRDLDRSAPRARKGAAPHVPELEPFDDVGEPIVRTLGLSELGWITREDTRPANPGRLLAGTRRSSASHISRAE